MLRLLNGKGLLPVVPPSLEAGAKITAMELNGVVYVTNSINTGLAGSSIESIPADTLAVSTTLEILPEYSNFPVSMQQAIRTLEAYTTSIYTAGYGASGVSVFDASGTPIDDFPIASNFITSCFDGNNFWLGTAYNGMYLPKLIVMDLTGTILQNYTLSTGMVVGLAFDGDYIWVTTRLQFGAVDTIIDRYDAITGAYVDTIDLGVTDVIVQQFDGTYLWGTRTTNAPVFTFDSIASSSGSVIKIDPITQTIVGTYPLGNVVRRLSRPYGLETYIGVGYLTGTVYNTASQKYAWINKSDGTVMESHDLPSLPNLASEGSCIDSRGYGFLALGSCTKVLRIPPPPAPTLDANFLLQFTSLPLFDSITPSLITITSPNSPTLVSGVFGNALTFDTYPTSQTTGLLIQTPIIYSGEDFTVRFRLKNLGTTIWNYSHHFQVNNYDIINSFYGYTHLFADNLTIALPSYPKTYLNSFRAISFEVFSGTAYLYFDGTLVASWAFTLNNPTNPLSFGFGVGQLELAEIFIDELAFFDNIALAGGASSYTVETTPYL